MSACMSCGELSRRDMGEEFEQFDEFTATFRPLHTDNLTPLARECIGERRRWSIAWRVEIGAYTGQWACLSMDPGALPIGWVPLCDLAEIER